MPGPGPGPRDVREEVRVPGFKKLSLLVDLSAARVLKDTQTALGIQIRAPTSAPRNEGLSERLPQGGNSLD